MYVVEYIEHSSTLAVRDWHGEMYELPVVGSRYWRDDVAYTVRDVSHEQTPVRVELAIDASRSREVAERLPSGWSVSVGRSKDTAEWRAELWKGSIPHPPPVFGMTGDAAVDELLGRAGF